MRENDLSISFSIEPSSDKKRDFDAIVRKSDELAMERMDQYPNINWDSKDKKLHYPIINSFGFLDNTPVTLRESMFFQALRSTLPTELNLGIRLERLNNSTISINLRCKYASGFLGKVRLQKRKQWVMYPDSSPKANAGFSVIEVYTDEEPLKYVWIYSIYCRYLFSPDRYSISWPQYYNKLLQI